MDSPHPGSPEWLAAQDPTYFRTLVEHSADVLWVLDREGVVRHVTPSLSRILGYRPQDVVGRRPWDLMDAADATEASQVFQAVSGSVEPVTSAHRFRHVDGGTRMLECTARNLLDDPHVGAVVVSSHDVTDQRLAEEALRASEARLRTAVHSTPIVLYTLDREGRFTSSDGKGLERLGLTPGEVVGRSAYEMYAAIPELQDNVRRALAGETVRYMAVFGQLQYDTTYAPLRDARGEIIGIIGASFDVTDQKKLEEQFLQAQKMEAVGRLAGGVAHDFNNLITAILGYADLVQESFDPQDPRRDDVAQIARAGQRAADLTRQLLTFARRQASAARMIDLNELVSHLGRLLARLIGDNILLGTQLAADLWPVLADAAQIEQVVLNLAVNARDAMPRGGRLAIRTANVDVRDEATGLDVGLAPGEYVLLTVTDTGVGMDEATLEHLFEPFYTTKEPGRGTGLGLATCYGIVKQARGHIAASSVPGQGSTFYVWLPRATGEIDRREPSEAERRIRPGTETILLVEDEPLVRDLAERSLRQLGYRVLVAPSGTRAVDLTRGYAGDIHLLISDLVMPRMSGQQLAAELRAMRPGLRVVYISGYTEETTPAQLQAEGAVLLWKPFTRDQLGRTVREILDSRRT
jgi:PAS domain S-box-containing protein